MKHPGRVDDVEGVRFQAGMVQIRFDEADAADAKPSRRRAAKTERRPRDVRADDETIGVGEVQGHLSRPASDLDDSSIGGNGAVEQLGKAASLRAGAKRSQRVVRWIARKRRFVIEAPDDLGTRIDLHRVRRSRK